MKLHELKPAANATKSSKRIGRGQGSGKGGTATKGHKGAQSRSGYSRKLGFEGGQMPIYRLLPKRGFKNINRREYSPINLSTVQQLAEKTQHLEITLELMKANGLISLKDKIKILGNGELTSKLTVTAHAFSKSAKEAIENAGGKCLVIGEEKKTECTKARINENAKVENVIEESRKQKEEIKEEINEEITVVVEHETIATEDPVQTEEPETSVVEN
jgi:large subunit ribosomal protein L15